MRKHYQGQNGSVVLGLGFDSVDAPGVDGAVTVAANSISLTIDGTDYHGVTGVCTIPPDQNAHPANASTPYTGTFTFTMPDGSAMALSGTVTGSFDGDQVFWPDSFTDVALGADIPPSADFNRILLPLDDDQIAMGTASVIIKPN
jgi:hypothetical protein